MLHTHSADNYHDWHSRSLYLSGILAIQDPPIGGSASHFSYQDHGRQGEEVPRCLLPEEVCRCERADPLPMPRGVYEPGSFGVCLADFDPDEYGNEYVRLRRGNLLVRSTGDPADQGWSYGWTVDEGRAAVSGWFPTDYFGQPAARQR